MSAIDDVAAKRKRVSPLWLGGDGMINLSGLLTVQECAGHSLADRRRNLVRAAALIVAEIDKMDGETRDGL